MGFDQGSRATLSDQELDLLQSGGWGDSQCMHGDSQTVLGWKSVESAARPKAGGVGRQTAACEPKGKPRLCLIASVVGHQGDLQDKLAPFTSRRPCSWRGCREPAGGNELLLHRKLVSSLHARCNRCTPIFRLGIHCTPARGPRLFP